jgi:hypothetical protein
MPDEPAQSALRYVALAVSVLDDVDLEPFGDGVVLRDGPPVEVTWRELRRVLAGEDPKSDLARRRVRRHLRARRWIAGVSADELGQRARPVGIPVGDALHPGVDWVRERLLGGVLDLGYGVVGVGPDPDAVIVCPAAALEAAGVDPADWWPVTRHYVERMGAVAVERLGLDRSGALRPIGDCDVVTLMASRVLRGHLCSGAAGGLRTAAVPMRRRGWLDPARIDPAFAVAAAAATDVEDRGFPRPLLLTYDEVALAPAGGRPAEIVLRDAAVSAERFERPLRWR